MNREFEEESDGKAICPVCGKARTLDEQQFGIQLQYGAGPALELCDCGASQTSVMQWDGGPGEISPNYFLTDGFTADDSLDPPPRKR